MPNFFYKKLVFQTFWISWEYKGGIHIMVGKDRLGAEVFLEWHDSSLHRQISAVSFDTLHHLGEWQVTADQGKQVRTARST